MKRTTKTCKICNKHISLSNISKHERAHKTGYLSKYVKNKIILIKDLKTDEKTGKYICPHCKKQYCKMGISTHVWRKHTKAGIQHTLTHDPNGGYVKGTRTAWNKGLTKETHTSLAKMSKTYKKRIKLGEIKSSKGRRLTNETKEKLSKAAIKRKQSGGFQHVEHYYIYSPHTGKKHHVRGGYELNYAKYLNENKISWERGHAIQYKHNKEDYTHNYMPDFYLVDTGEYIETKGYYSDYDKKKMKAVKKCNPGVKITLLFYDDLKKLGVL